jgi:CheY-like chemotaxis protein/HPt (histidine-containing phosphotransfer) domain-containing protein
MPVSVLVIDDDSLSREVLTLLLDAAGYIAESTDSGEAAVSLLQSAHSPPQVILADLQMPGITGNALARSLRPLCAPAATLFAMSATAPENSSTRDFDGFLLKPFSIDTFTAALTGAVPKSASGSQTEEPCILDESTYHKLTGSMQPQQLEQLYALFLSDIDSRFVKMQLAASSGDNATLRTEAHAIKGSSGMVGAVELQTLATSMEMGGLSDDHVASLKEFPLAARRLRRILIARETSHQEKMRDEGSNKKV